MKSHVLLASFLMLGVPLLPTSACANAADDLKAGYDRANSFQDRAKGAVLNATLEPHWVGTSGFWYVKQLPGGSTKVQWVDLPSGKERDAFSQAKLAAEVNRLGEAKVDPAKWSPAELTTTDGIVWSFKYAGKIYSFDNATGGLGVAVTPAPPVRLGAPPRGRRGRTQAPPADGDLRIEAGQVQAKKPDGTWATLTKEGNFETMLWAPDHQHVLAMRVMAGDRKKLYLLHATGDGKTRATLEERLYDQPGDKLDTYEPYMLDAAAGTEAKVQIEPITGGAYPWPGAPNARVWRGRFILDFPMRGYQEYKVVSIDPGATSVKTIVDEKSPTFIDIGRTRLQLLDRSDELVWRSERDGWARLYLIDAQSGRVENAITPTGGVFREIVKLDEPSRSLIYQASGFAKGQDPYYVHEYSVKLDGTGNQALTQGDGTHEVKYSPDGGFYVDTYSRVDAAPIHELRRTFDGGLIRELERADVTQLLKNGVRLPERFVAKARDGKTDIYGVVIIPTNYNPHHRYPVIENIYAGPQDSFVPKKFAPFLNMNRLAELGFIVVQIDGMGTANRGKAFHDVCYKNLADAGFPDRILWMKALAKKMPSADISRVGVYGTSAGGQNAAGAVIFHPEFYKAAVASCGCHDNRIDKQWWNEQWMGYPVGPEYAEQSNITNAAKLGGKLFLMVGEDDHNVPPETTIRLVDALMKANKDFDFLILPGFDHTDGGPYGEHKRRDFFVRNLLGQTPPAW